MEQKRLRFLDGVRGAALVLMMLNHTGHWWIDRSMGWPRYYTIYTTVTLAAPLFLFLLGFCLALVFQRAADRGAAVRRYVVRGLRLVVAGLLLNVIVFPRDPFWTGGVLQTIGLSLVVMAPLGGLLSRRAWRAALVAVAALGYAAYAWSFGTLTGWSTSRPVLSEIFFKEFPPWPWVGLPIVGLVAGAVWLDARRRGRENAYFRAMAIAGALSTMAFVVVTWATAEGLRFGFVNDLMLNRHWTPGPVTLLWVMGMTALVIAAGYWVMEIRGWRLQWLVMLGQTAMILYFVHQIVALTVVREWLGVRITHWTIYIGANVAFVIALVGMARLWIAVRRVLPRHLIPYWLGGTRGAAPTSAVERAPA